MWVKAFQANLGICFCDYWFALNSVKKSVNIYIQNVCVCFDQARTNESLKVPQLDIAVPMNLKDKSKKTGQCPNSCQLLLNLNPCKLYLWTWHFLSRTVSVNLYPMKEEEVPKEEDRSIEFVLMTRRGNRQHVSTWPRHINL